MLVKWGAPLRGSRGEAAQFLEGGAAFPPSLPELSVYINISLLE